VKRFLVLEYQLFGLLLRDHHRQIGWAEVVLAAEKKLSEAVLVLTLDDALGQSLE
jgi:hypothetical protein